MKKTAILLLCSVTILLSTSNSSGQNIYNFAGFGAGGYSGDGGPALSAQIKLPFGIATDASGNVYYCDQHRVRKINTSGIITTIAGTGVSGFSGDGGQATLAQLNNPFGITVDIAGNIYISDVTNNRIRKINTSGVINTITGTGSAGFSGDGGPAIAAQIVSVFGMVTDATGNFYFGDVQNQRIRKISTTGTITTIAGTGINGHSGDNGPALSANICNPQGITIDALGNIYFTEYGPIYSSVRKINTSGIIKTIAGKSPGGFSGDGGISDSAEVLGPRGITVDASGNIYFADENNYRVRKISTSGTITTIAGNGTANYSGDGGPATSAQFNGCGFVAVDASNNIFITDYWNNRLRVICSGSCYVGINEYSYNSSSIKIYPNPNNGAFKLQIDNEIENGELILMNSLGQKVFEQKILQGQNNFITNDLAKGLYNYIILQDKGQISNGKLTID